MVYSLRQLRKIYNKFPSRLLLDIANKELTSITVFFLAENLEDCDGSSFVLGN